MNDLLENIHIDFHYRQMPDIIYGYVIVISLCTYMNIHKSGLKNSKI